jgi:hypothetical protein
MMTENRTVRPSPIAGTWYSANPSQLRNAIAAYIDDAQNPDLPGEVVGLVAPHAGYIYSGAIAGHAFKTVQGRTFDCVCVLSPMHQYYPQPLLTSAHSAYRTPLGEIPLADAKIDQIQNKLSEKIGIGLTPIAKDGEHSLEIELPFLQIALEGGFTLIPIMLRDQSPQVTQALGEVLAEVLDADSCLLVASSDLSHFFTKSQANQLDKKVLDALVEFSPQGLFDLKDRGQGQACGLAPMAALLWASAQMGATDVTLLKYDTSAATTGDTSSVVGYGAAAITRPY